MTRTFVDSNDGVYNTDGSDTPQWAKGMTEVPFVAPTPTLAQQIAHMDGLVEGLLDTIAQRKKYKNSDRLVGYLSDPDPAVANEARTFITYRSSVWAHCNALLNAVMAGTTPAPTDDQLISGLPLFNDW